MIWWNKCDIPNDYEEYKLLNPTSYTIDQQDDFLKGIHFPDYFNEESYRIHGGNTSHEWHPHLVRNHLCALESQSRVYNKVLESGIQYDYIIFVRPDVQIHNDFNVAWLNTEFDIAITDHDHYEGLNDRFAFMPFNKADKYATRINEIAEFRRNHGRIVSEKYTKFTIDKYYKNVQLVDFRFSIWRPDNRAG
jgi:hypothetical protein